MGAPGSTEQKGLTILPAHIENQARKHAHACSRGLLRTPAHAHTHTQTASSVSVVTVGMPHTQAPQA